MKILFDQGTPVPLRAQLSEHTVDTAYEQGWSSLQNGDLLQAAENAGYDAFVTTDQTLAILVLLSTSWPRIRPHMTEICQAIEGLVVVEYKEFEIDS